MVLGNQFSETYLVFLYVWSLDTSTLIRGTKEVSPHRRIMNRKLIVFFTIILLVFWLLLMLGSHNRSQELLETLDNQSNSTSEGLDEVLSSETFLHEALTILGVAMILSISFTSCRIKAIQKNLKDIARSHDEIQIKLRNAL